MGRKPTFGLVTLAAWAVLLIAASELMTDNDGDEFDVEDEGAIRRHVALQSGF